MITQDSVPGRIPMLALPAGRVLNSVGEQKAAPNASCRLGVPVLDSGERHLERDPDRPPEPRLVRIRWVGPSAERLRGGGCR